MAKDRKKSGEAEINFDVGSLGVGGILKGVGDLIDRVSKIEEGKTESQFGEIEGLNEEVKAVYGFTVKVGLGGTPVVERFGNIRDTDAGPTVEKVREPLIDVMEEKDAVVVIAELPGVGNEAVDLSVHDGILDVKAGAGDRRYAKEVPLPFEVDEAGMKRSYRNGILKVVLPKRSG